MADALYPDAVRLGRRAFARLLTLGGSAALLTRGVDARAASDVIPAPPGATDAYWTSVRNQFVMPRELAVLNAANLCPASAPVLEALEATTRSVDRDPSSNNRAKQREGKEATRRLLAEFLRVSPDEIVITRNTSEANNLVSSGLDLQAGDEVVLFSDNHPSNLAAWQAKAQRFGFAVRMVDQVNPHPGADYYIDAFAKQTTAKTKVWGFTHVTNSVGDQLPVAELCRAARDRGILTLVDGAQSFGVLDVNLAMMRPDFYSGSAHKWPCGPRESGVLYVAAAAQPRLAPSIISLYGGAAGISKTHEAFGQRDEPAILAFGEALKFQNQIGRPAIESRARELAQALLEGLRRIDGVRIWTHADPERSAGIVTFQAAGLDPAKLAAALYDKHRIACATRTGKDRPGIRFSPHFYNLHEEVDRALTAVAAYVRTGV